MTADIFDKALIELLDRKPFTAFVVELDNGERFEVMHANGVVLRDGKAFYVAPKFTSFQLFNNDNVVRFIPTPQSATI